MSGDVRFQLLTHAEVEGRFTEQMLALLGRAFGRWPFLDPGVAAADHLRWKMESPGCPYAAMAGWLGPRMVTARVVVRQRVVLRGESRVLLDTPDLCVDPEFQGRGISKLFSQWRDAWVSPNCDFEIDDASNPRLTRSRHRRRSLPIGNRMRALYRVLDPARLPHESLSRGHAPAFAVLLSLRALAAAGRVRDSWRRRARRGHDLRTVARLDERADAFFEQAAQPFELAFDAGHARLNWRYCDRRAGPFVVRTAEEAGAMAGFAVHRLGRPRGHLVDLLVLPGRHDLVEALASDAVTCLAASGAAEVLCWLPDRHPYRAPLRRAGFVTLPTPIPQRYRAHRMAPPELAFLGQPDARLHLTMGATDFV